MSFVNVQFLLHPTSTCQLRRYAAGAQIPEIQVNLFFLPDIHESFVGSSHNLLTCLESLMAFLRLRALHVINWSRALAVLYMHMHRVTICKVTAYLEHPSSDYLGLCK